MRRASDRRSNRGSATERRRWVEARLSSRVIWNYHNAAVASPESEAIPYEALNFRGERMLVLAPHPDDEVIGCGGVVFQHLRDGRDVRVAVATDGVEAAPGEERDTYSL